MKSAPLYDSLMIDRLIMTTLESNANSYRPQTIKEVAEKIIFTLNPSVTEINLKPIK